MRFWVGGYSGADGAAEGIGVLQAGTDASASGPMGMLPAAVAASGSPSWVAAHPALDVVYAALEHDGTVQAYRRTGEATLARLGAPVEAGEAVCHVAVSPDGSYLLASCWGDGRVVRMNLDAAGRPVTREEAAPATDPYGGEASDAPAPRESAPLDLAAATRALREAAGEEFAHLVPGYDEPATEPEAAASADRVSRAHQAVFLPGGLVASTDLGHDLVRFWRPTSEGLRAAQQVALPQGSGPRHAVWHPSGHLYVVAELSCEVFVLAPDREGRWRLMSGAPLMGVVDGDAAAEISTSRDGLTVYAGVRGSDTIGVLRVQGAGESLQLLALVESGTAWPRHHLVVDDTLLVAGQRADEVVSLALDARTGVPGRVRHRTPAGSPTCLTRAR